MTTNRLWLPTLCLTGAAALAPAVSSADVNLEIDIAPPAACVEPIPGPRVGHVWAPGYWEWSGHEQVWAGGRWMHERRGRHWIPEHWVQNGPHWHMERGHWER